MSTSPLVSIIIPVFNDEGWVSAALESCLAQTLDDIEVICVDDASTDGSRDVIESYRARDPRIQLIRQETNRSAFQARRVGILAARAPYVLFLDADDELAPNAARLALEKAQDEGADLVGIGVEIVTPDGRQMGRFERDLQPAHDLLIGQDIVASLFPVGKTAQGHLWRYLWDVELLRAAYAALPGDLTLYRANDIPIAFLAIAAAHKYVSAPERLYRYYWRRGVSGQQVDTVEAFDFYLSAMDSIESIAPGVDAMAERAEDANLLRAAYESARLSTINVVLRYCEKITSPEFQIECIERLNQRAGESDVVMAAATFFREGLPLLARHRASAPALRPDARRVLITTGNLGSGGVQGVVVSQARHLADAGYEVVVAVRHLAGLVHELPEGVELREIAGISLGERLASYLEICSEFDIDVIIDHWILYNDDWPFFALAATTHGLPTIGWLHNFALRPILDFNARMSFLTTYLPLMARVVVLSPTDVAFWKLRGIDRTVYLPNPPSPLLQRLEPRVQPRKRNVDEPLRLVWWGRLQQHTKRVRDLIDVAAVLRELGVDFRLAVIGPDTKDLSAEQLRELAGERGVEELLELPGPLHSDELLAELERADVYVGASAIEGYPLVLTEAQALGLPIVMYELPWLAILEGNRGIVTAAQGDVRGVARELAAIATDSDRYATLSAGSLEAARGSLSHDFTALYSQLLQGSLTAEYSPDPTREDARLLLDLVISFEEENVAREGRHARRLAERNSKIAAEYRREIARLTARVKDLAEKVKAERVVTDRQAAKFIDASTKLKWERMSVERLRGENEELRRKVNDGQTAVDSFSEGWLDRILSRKSRTTMSAGDVRAQLAHLESRITLAQRDTLVAIGTVMDELAQLALSTPPESETSPAAASDNDTAATPRRQAGAAETEENR